MPTYEDVEVITLLHVENGAKTVKVEFDSGAEKQYVYLVDSDTAARLSVGDYAVVRNYSKKGFGVVVRVVEVHTVPQIDFGSGIDYKWAVLPEEIDTLRRVDEQNNTLREAIRRAEARKRLEAAVGELNVKGLLSNDVVEKET